MNKIDKRNGIIKVTVLVVLLGFAGAFADAVLYEILHTDRPVQLFGWLLPAGAAVGIIAGELTEIRLAIRSENKEKHHDN